MNCDKNGIKREGESCSLNNNCIYPNCMKELELEAEQYYKENVEGEPLTYETPIHCFIAGATSKYVEKQKLEFAIEQLNNCIDMFGNVNFTTLTGIKYTLKQKLKEHETN